MNARPILTPDQARAGGDGVARIINAISDAEAGDRRRTQEAHARRTPVTAQPTTFALAELAAWFVIGLVVLGATIL